MDPLSNEYISRLLGQAAAYGNNSFAGDWHNARAMRDELDNLYGSYDFADSSYYGKVSAGLRNQQSSALAGGLISGLTGATQLTGNAMQAAQIGDTSRYENELQDYVDYSNYNFANYDSLSNAMAQNYLSPMPDHDEIRGMTKGEKVGNLASSTLQGAQMGMQIGGPVGAAIGGAAGLLSSGIGILVGDKKAERQKQYLNAQATLAQNAANQNFQAAHERISDYNTRKGAVNAVAKGGPIDRKQSIAQYADNVLGKPQRRESRPTGVTRKTVDGGVQYRFRTK